MAVFHVLINTDIVLADLCHCQSKSSEGNTAMLRNGEQHLLAADSQTTKPGEGTLGVFSAALSLHLEDASLKSCPDEETHSFPGHLGGLISGRRG